MTQKANKKSWLQWGIVSGLPRYAADDPLSKRCWIPLPVEASRALRLRPVAGAVNRSIYVDISLEGDCLVLRKSKEQPSKRKVSKREGASRRPSKKAKG